MKATHIIPHKIRDEIAVRMYLNDFHKQVGPVEDEFRTDLTRAEHVIYETHWLLNPANRVKYQNGTFHHQNYSQEHAMAKAMAKRKIPYSRTRIADEIVNKKVYWIVRQDLFSPQVWNYSLQTHQFAQALEDQGNRLCASSSELLFWENKGYMHRKFEESGISTPPTVILTESNSRSVDLPSPPLLIKEEHSSASAGIHFFSSVDEARKFVAKHSWKRGESLIAQSIIPGATKDLRVTMVGETLIKGATYWRVKSPEALSSKKWTPTATSFNSTVIHDMIPDGVGEFVADLLRKTGLRMGGADLMWPNDDVTQTPMVLEVSPHFQPNPPKPERYKDLPYKVFKKMWRGPENYYVAQHKVFEEISEILLDKQLL
jgi:hypothetical protein